jgi:hypothetical protein
VKFCIVIASVAATLFVMFFVPETRGKTLDEVEQMFINHVQDGGRV